MRKKLLADFSMNELREIYSECGSQKVMAERLGVSTATISNYIGRKGVRGKHTKGWSVKAEPMTAPVSETAKVIEAPVIKPAVSIGAMEVGVNANKFSFSLSKEHIDIWDGKGVITVRYEDVNELFSEISDALKVADKLHGVLKPYMEEQDASADESR